MMIRHPVAAGQFYPESPSQLESMIEGLVDENNEKEEVIGLVSPHAGYIYSGSVAGAVISKANLKDTVIIVGPNHTGMGKFFSIMTDGAWETPLGQMEIDSTLGKQILAASDYLQEDHVAHQHEHSIEVQLPFLQYFKSDIKLVPIILSHASGDIYRKIGRGIAQAIQELNREVIIIASTDMTHYEP
ncbi:AmmeMemoRadiSam system protein B, partial [Chloroflexota bacterium]